MHNLTENDWITGQVPGSVYADLLREGKIDDPFYRDNEQRAKLLAENDYEYVREFKVDEALLGEENLLLCCDGLDTVAEILINGHFVGSAFNMHRQHEFDVKPFLRVGANEIRVILRSPNAYIRSQQQIEPVMSVMQSGHQYIRKAACMFGWDWGPVLPDAGIYKEIYILGFEQRIEDLHIRQKHEGGVVEIEVELLSSPGTQCTECEVTLRSPDGDARSRIVLLKNNRALTTFKVENPKLWWPNGYGEQPLYEITVQLLKEGAVCCERSLSIGLRTLTMRYEPDQWGNSLEFVVNGRSIFAKGGAYIPEDNLITRVTKERSESLIRKCARANFNCIRVWGGALFGSDDLYDLCDRYGIIVWQDLMFACSMYPTNEAYIRNVKAELVDNVRRLRHHASLGIWCGNNEIEYIGQFLSDPEVMKAFIPSDGEPSPEMAEMAAMFASFGDLHAVFEGYKPHYVRLFGQIIPEILGEYDPDTFYLRSSPCSDEPFVNANDFDWGDDHNWDIWHGGKPITDFREHYYRFMSEFGFGALPNIKTIEAFTEPSDRKVDSDIINAHFKDAGGNGKIKKYLKEYFKEPAGLPEYIYASQVTQAEAVKYAVEHCRRHFGRCMGTIIWQLNDCWPTTSWSSVDYFGRLKALHYYARHFFAPLLLSACDDGLKVSLHVTNETFDEVIGTIEWQLCRNSGEVLLSGSKPANVPAFTAQSCVELDFSSEVKEAELGSIYLRYALVKNGQSVSGGNLLFVKPRDFAFIDPRLTVSVEDKEEKLLVTVSAQSFARGVELDLKEADCEFSDNFFDISGEPVTVEVEKKYMSKELTAEEFKNQLVVRSAYELI